MGKENDHMIIIALATALDTCVSVEYMDRGEGNKTTRHIFPEDQTPKLFLLYRPGHYDLLYPCWTIFEWYMLYLIAFNIVPRSLSFNMFDIWLKDLGFSEVNEKIERFWKCSKTIVVRWEFSEKEISLTSSEYACNFMTFKICDFDTLLWIWIFNLFLGSN